MYFKYRFRENYIYMYVKYEEDIKFIIFENFSIFKIICIYYMFFVYIRYKCFMLKIFDMF